MFELDGATGVTLENLNLTGAAVRDLRRYRGGEHARDGDQSFVYGNAAFGMDINTTQRLLHADGTQVYLNEQGGVDLGSNDATLSDDTVWRNTSYGVYLSGARADGERQQHLRQRTGHLREYEQRAGEE